MTKYILSVSLAALLAAGGLAAAQAQQGQPGQGGPMQDRPVDRPVDRPDQPETGTEATGEQDGPMGMQGMESMHRMMEQMMQRMGRDDGMRGMMGRHHGMRGMGQRGGHHGMRGQHRAQMLRTMIILMDNDADGALSLEEVQSVTQRFFNAMDEDGNDNLTVDEIRAFYMGGALPGMGQDGGEADTSGENPDQGGPGGNQ